MEGMIARGDQTEGMSTMKVMLILGLIASLLVGCKAHTALTHHHATTMTRTDHCLLTGDHLCGPGSGPSCGWIDGSEFPAKAGQAFTQCWRNTWHHKWRWVGDYDRQRLVWELVGPTTIFVNQEGWWETS